MGQSESAAVSAGGKEAPSLFLIIKPDEKAYPILTRVSRRSAKELTAKDLWDFFGNVDVLVHLKQAPFDIRGIPVGGWSLQYSVAPYALDKVKELGANSVLIDFSLYMTSSTASEVLSSPYVSEDPSLPCSMESDTELVRLVSLAQGRDLEVALRAFLWVNGNREPWYSIQPTDVDA